MGWRAIIMALAAAACAGGAIAQAPIVPVTPDIPTDAYSPGRALVADLDRIVSPNGVQESFIQRVPGARLDCGALHHAG